MRPTREQAWQTLTQYTKSEALLRHALAVEASVGFYARLYGEDEELWRATALLHDFDYEIHPTLDKHPQDGAPILREEGYPEELIEAVLSHAEHLAMPRDTQLKKVLFACDELSGFVHACGLVRPTGLDGLEPKSVKKKLKQPSFAAGVHRDEVYAGAELLGLELDEHITNVVTAMQPIAGELGLEPPPTRVSAAATRTPSGIFARSGTLAIPDLRHGVALEEREDAFHASSEASANSSCLRSKKLCGAPVVDHDLVLDSRLRERRVEGSRLLRRDSRVVAALEREDRRRELGGSLTRPRRAVVPRARPPVEADRAGEAVTGCGREPRVASAEAEPDREDGGAPAARRCATHAPTSA